MAGDTLKIKRNLIHWSRDRSKINKVPHTITVNDFEVPDICPVLGIPLKVGKGKATWNSPTLDRILPELGYVAGNVVVISNRANQLKTNASFLELKKLVEFYEAYISTHWMKNDLSNRTNRR